MTIPPHIKSRYFELTYLAEYFRWSIKHGATGSRSPIDGKFYRTSWTNEVHHEAGRQASKAKARVYLKEARELRLKYLKR